METETLQAPAARSAGRWLFVSGWLLLVIGVAAYFVQFLALKQYVVPWYAPILGTAGVVAMVAGVSQRWTVLRIMGLGLSGLFVFFEWYVLLFGIGLPAYAGPAAGQPMPSFAAVRADGGSFTDKDLLGQATVVLYFRGHW